MVLLRSCCLCVAPQTAAFALGSWGILAGSIFMSPIIAFLEDHSFYITQFARIQRENNNYMDDERVPQMVLYSKILYSALLAIDVIYIFSCILLLVGIAAKKHLLIVPWLAYMFAAILVIITIVISFIIGLEDYVSLAVFLGSTPIILLNMYIWMVVLSAYQLIRAETKPERGPTASASQSSLVSIKEGIQRVLGGTPPPPYEAVTTEVGSPKKKGKYSRQISAESATSDTMFFDISSTRRSSDNTPSTKPASPTPFQLNQFACKQQDVTPILEVEPEPKSDYNKLFKSSSKLSSSVSQSNLCTRHSPKISIKKSSSSYQNFTRQLNQVNPAVLASKSTKSLVEKSADLQGEQNNLQKSSNEDDLMTTWSSLSDGTSSMSTTSLESPNPNNILV